MRTSFPFALPFALVSLLLVSLASAQELVESGGTDEPSRIATIQPSDTAPADPPGMDAFKRIDEKHQVWIDTKTSTVFLGAEVSCRKGVLEMFACPAGTKEYESVVAVQSPAYLVHAALLAVGAEPGSPVKFNPEYQAATGQIIDVFVRWEENGVQKRERAQQWVKHLKTGKAMEHDWVFGGSGFWMDEESGEKFYHAEGGELICVSNFSTALMDVTVESPQQNNDLLFGTFTEHIPPLGTQVVVELTPRKSE